MPTDSPTVVGPAAGRTPITFVWILSIVLLISCGIAYTWSARGLQDGLKPVPLPVPLKALPCLLNGWTGVDQNIPAITQEYMRTHFADDYVSRYYTNGTTRQAASVYVVYCSSRPGGIIGHKPEVCLPNNGYTLDRTDRSQIRTQSGRRIDCLVQRFHKTGPPRDDSSVVSFYVLDGRFRASENDFGGLLSRFWGRRPNISGNSARYVAQVQIAAVDESSAMAAANDLTDAILSFLPNVNGKNTAGDAAP